MGPLNIVVERLMQIQILEREKKRVEYLISYLDTWDEFKYQVTWMPGLERGT